MTLRGYPMTDFDRRAEDLSVDHPHVVQHYRSAHVIAERHAQGAASTEELRQALVSYRALFEDLLEVREPQRRRA
jgi:2-hydroxychromene-2-carboxylate isomerase